MGMSEIISLCQEDHLGDIIKNKNHILNVYLLLMFHVSFVRCMQPNSSERRSENPQILLPHHVLLDS